MELVEGDDIAFHEMRLAVSMQKRELPIAGAISEKHLYLYILGVRKSGEHMLSRFDLRTKELRQKIKLSLEGVRFTKCTSLEIDESNNCLIVGGSAFNNEIEIAHLAAFSLPKLKLIGSKSFDEYTEPLSFIRYCSASKNIIACIGSGILAMESTKDNTYNIIQQFKEKKGAVITDIAINSENGIDCVYCLCEGESWINKF